MPKVNEASANEANEYSEEFEIDRRIEALIGKIVARAATAEDYDEYNQLSRRRVEMMMPRIPSTLHKLRNFA